MERLKVFLSSTQKELQPERDSAEALVAELGHHCLRSETLDAPGCSPWDACKSMAEACDIYVGIFGSSYGYRVPNLGISATEMEYRTARTADPGKIFIYIKESEVHDVDQKRFLEEVQGFSTGYFRHAKFETCAELAEQIRRDVITWTTQRVREARNRRIELLALRDKVAHMARVMEYYGVPEDLR